MKVTFEIPDDVASKLPEEGLEQELLTDLVCGLEAQQRDGLALAWNPEIEVLGGIGQAGYPPPDHAGND